MERGRENCRLGDSDGEAYFEEADDDDEEQNEAAGGLSYANGAQGDDEDEVDPLDAFMESIGNELKGQEEERLKGTAQKLQEKEKPEHEQFVPEDAMASFYDFVESRTLTVPRPPNSSKRVAFTRGSGGAALQQGKAEGEEEQSDDEVYEVARMVEGDEDRWATGRKPLKPLTLPKVDHAVIDYRSFPKDLYRENDGITAMTHEEVTASKASMAISATGYNIPRPLYSFAHLSASLDKRLFSRIVKKGYTSPTAVQAQTLPVALKGRDLIALAETGSGKTAAYLLPAIQHVLAALASRGLAKLPPGEGPLVMVMAPTRELAMQIGKECLFFVKKIGVSVSVLSGGYNKTDQFKDIRRGFEIAIGNPGRIIDLARMNNGLKFHAVTFLVLDEADRMLALGFEGQVRAVCESVRPDRQTCLLSATMPPMIERLARDVLTSPVRVTVGERGQAATAVEQEIVIVDNEQKKWKWAAANIRRIVEEGQLLVFCSSHSRVTEIAQQLEKELAAPADSSQQQQRGQSDASIPHSAVASSEDPLLPSSATVETSDGSGVSHQLPKLESTSRVAENSTTGSAAAAAPTPVRQQCLVGSLHGDFDQTERMKVLSQFRRGVTKILVATDVASRGLDIPKIQTVLNYDVAKTIDTHTHRIGRTGRAGRAGKAITLLPKSDCKMAAQLVESFESVNRPLPPGLLDLGLSFGPFRAARLAGQKMHIGKGGQHGPKTGGGGLGYTSAPLGGTSDSAMIPTAPEAAASTAVVADAVKAAAADQLGGHGTSGAAGGRKRRWDSSGSVDGSGAAATPHGFTAAAATLGMRTPGDLSASVGGHLVHGVGGSGRADEVTRKTVVPNATGLVVGATDELPSSSEEEEDEQTKWQDPHGPGGVASWVKRRKNAQHGALVSQLQQQRLLRTLSDARLPGGAESVRRDEEKEDAAVLLEQRQIALKSAAAAVEAAIRQRASAATAGQPSGDAELPTHTASKKSTTTTSRMSGWDVNSHSADEPSRRREDEDVSRSTRKKPR